MARLAALQWMVAAALGSAGCSPSIVAVAAETAANSPRAAVSTLVAPPARVPGAIVLFSGSPEELQNHWLRRSTQQPAAWKIQDGALVAGGGDIVTRQEFQ